MWDREFHPEDHWLATRGCSFFIFPTGWSASMGKNNWNPDLVCENLKSETWWMQGTDFSITFSNKQWILFLAKYLILYRKNMKKTSRTSWIRWDVTWWRNFTVTMTSRINMQPACSRRAAISFSSFQQAGTSPWVKTMEIPIWCARVWSPRPHNLL